MTMITDDETKVGLGDPPDDPMYEADEPTRIFGTSGKTIPFGSTLASHPLRVSLDGGTVKLRYGGGAGGPVDVVQLPKWERVELMRHIEFALETGRL